MDIMHKVEEGERLSINTLKSAIDYNQDGKIEEWIHGFLLGEGDNIPFSEGLKLQKRYYYGPVKMKLSHFKRCCGPEACNKYVVNEKYFYSNVNNIMERFKTGWDMPPLIINYSKEGFELNDGNHRYEALVRLNIPDYYVIIWTSSKTDMNNFLGLIREEG